MQCTSTSLIFILVTKHLIFHHMHSQNFFARCNNELQQLPLVSTEVLSNSVEDDPLKIINSMPYFFKQTPPWSKCLPCLAAELKSSYMLIKTRFRKDTRCQQRARHPSICTRHLSTCRSARTLPIAPENGAWRYNRHVPDGIQVYLFSSLQQLVWCYCPFA